MTDYSKKFRKERDKFKKKNIRRKKRGKELIDPSEYTFKYRPKGSGLFSKRKTSTVETRSEKQKRTKRKMPQQSIQGVGRDIASSRFGRGGITKGRDMFTQQYD
tara:strand:+ start:162 stop:473 length:312 start_codon:yes stop_codon:yes gene_type:complete